MVQPSNRVGPPKPHILLQSQVCTPLNLLFDFLLSHFFSACQAELDRWPASLADAKKCIELDDAFAKGAVADM